MPLKAVLFDFNGIIINDESLHERLIQQLLLEENLRITPEEVREVCLGRSDRVCLRELLEYRGRVVSNDYLEMLVARKARAYVEEIQTVEKLPIYVGLEDLLFKLATTACKLAVVSGALRSEIELVLNRIQQRDRFSVIVAGDDITTSKPAPDGYLLAIDRLNATFPDLQLQPSDCLAIEDTFVGITAAKQAKIPVLGVANTYPFHMLQRRANWTVDYLSDLELDRVQRHYESAIVSSD